MSKSITKVFHGGRFKQVATGKSKAVAEQEKKSLQSKGHAARITTQMERDRTKTYNIWKRG